MCDDFDIKSLPAEFVSVSRPSEVIRKLNEKRRDLHNESIRSMREQMRSLNLEVDEEIRKESEICINKLKALGEEADEFLRSVNHKYETLNDFDLEEDTVKNKFSRATEINTRQLKIVDELHEKLVSIEKSRSEKMKHIMRETKEQVQNISYKLPFKIDEFFENELVNINQITLNNHQSYAELKKELKLQVKNDMKRWSEQLLEFKEELKNILRIFAKKSVVKIQSGLKQDAISYISTDLAKEIIKIKSLHSEMQWYMSGENGFPVSHGEVEKWLKDVQKTLACIDQSAKNVVSFYKSIIIILFNRFFGELEDLKETMAKIGIVSPEDIEGFQSEIYTPAIDEINVQFHSDFDKLTTVWGNAINVMKDTLDKTYRFLKCAAVLWDKHFARVKELQSIVLHDVANTVATNNKSTEIFETELNIALEKLRQAPNEKKLEKHLGDIVKMLDNLEKLYSSHCVSETQVVYKYKTMMDMETEVFMSEIKRFLDIHPPDAERDPKKQRRRASQMSEKEVDPNENLVPKQILYCTYQVDAVKNWMFGLWEAIDHYLSTCRGEILVVTENWLKKQCEKINERLKVTLAFHIPRYQTIKYSIYEKRLMELTKHTDKIHNHKLAAEKEIKSLQAAVSSDEQKYADIYNQYTMKIENMLNEAKLLSKSYQIRSRLQDVYSLFMNHEQMLKTIEEEYVAACQNFKDRLMISNHQFVKASKLFSESGNFHIEEIKALQKNFNKLEQSAEKALGKCINEEKTKYGKYHSQLLRLHTNAMSTFGNLIEELEHNKKVVDRIKKLQKNIRSEVVSLKTKIQDISLEIKKFIQEAERKEEMEQYLKSFPSKYEKVFSDVQILYEFLNHSKTQVNLLPVTNVPSKKSSARLKSRSERRMNHSDNLFETEPKDENTFISKLNVLLYTSFLDIQREAKDTKMEWENIRDNKIAALARRNAELSMEFYAKHRNLLLDSSRLQQSYEECMEEVLFKYNSFQLQCDSCRTENAYIFLSILENFREFRKQYLDDFRNTFCRLGLSRCIDTSENIFYQLNEEKKRVRNTFQHLLNELKTLFGHPNNRDLLENLQKKFNAMVVQNERAFLEIPPPLMETLEKTHEEELQKFETIDEILISVSGDDRLELLIEELKTQLDTDTDPPNVKIADEQTEESEYSEQKSASKNVLNYLKNEPPTIANINSKIKSPTVISVLSDESFNTFDNPEEYSNELKRTLEANLNRITEFVDTHLIKYEEDLKEIWNGEMNFILAMYKVKYDEKNTF